MYIEEEIRGKIESFLENQRTNMGHALGIEFISFRKGEVKASMPVDENTIQPFGILHGGASVALAETTASIGAWLNLEDDSKSAVGVEINSNHIKSVGLGSRVVGTAVPLHRGRQIQVWEIEITTEEGTLVNVSRCTLAVVSR